MSGEILLDIQDLTTVFPGPAGELKAVDGLELQVRAGEVLGLVGESGCGKSVTALSVLGLLPSPGRVAGGRALFAGQDLLTLAPASLRALRGASISMVFQEPMTSLNPVFTVGRQVAELVSAHRDVSSQEAWDQAVEMLGQVGIPEPEKRARAYPHQLSGGLRQRVMIAMALGLSPRLVMADEPTTALDVTIQAQILHLLRSLQEQSGASVLLITHNLAVVAQMAGRVAVMYAGRLVEQAPVGELFQEPLHPYTRGLLACLPSRSPGRGQRLPTIAGIVPPLDALPPGCAFSDRCPERFAPCQEEEPALVEVAPGHGVRCYLHHRLSRRQKRAAA
ncbi:MAG: ABC transporter ATP-binding protein [Desulfarculus sp.]|nr:ABC transporter ATP-binding protein [Desulfarculus sp.]